MSKSPYLIKTQRLGLRPWHQDDLAPFAALNQDPEVMRYFPSMPDRAETWASMERQMVHQTRHGFCFWAADLLATGEFIGFIGLSTPRFETDFTPCVEIGWRLDKAYWGQGLAPEGATACLDYARATLHIPEVYSFTPVSNHPSERVMQKIGMQKIGTFLHPLIEEGHSLQEHLLYYINMRPPV
ncbi:MAG: GNAT family N-acetyltransferase [Saprospiraceae bacterium]|nr:GNAT family N-acetyltransferase [Saprospiraceae bacterium]